MLVLHPGSPDQCDAWIEKLIDIGIPSAAAWPEIAGLPMLLSYRVEYEDTHNFGTSNRPTVIDWRGSCHRTIVVNGTQEPEAVEFVLRGLFGDRVRYPNAASDATR